MLEYLNQCEDVNQYNTKYQILCIMQTHNIDGIGQLTLDPRDLIDNTVLNTGNWDAYQDPIFDRYIWPGMVTLDIGAHIGICSLKMSNRGAHVHSFEPDPTSYKRLCKHIADNHADIIPYNIALGSQVQMTQYGWYYPQNRGASGLIISDLYTSPIVQNNVRSGYVGISEPVFVSTIDCLKLDNVGFIKIDTEGCDKQVMMGGEATIRKYKPIILYEAEPELAQGIEQYITSLGYIVEKLEKTDYLAMPK